ncbi:hypothetical protein J5N97_000532 [Dioscorea zingiberensis]|uniref:VTT domain-containing protein n=1 Tax=Dioscorea zingiberensis TaxID=325984 RepID=A0A9D5BS86_9LILI|nr:hypothetical protein J5N97_000532 [Dioscorea zingiberensis]
MARVCMGSAGMGRRMERMRTDNYLVVTTTGCKWIARPSVVESKKPTLRKASSNAPQSFKFDNSKGGPDGPGPDGPEGGLGGDSAIAGSVLAGILLVGFIGGVGTVGFLYKDQINSFLNQFSGFIEGYGPAGYALFVAVYAGLEILAIPAIPLTMSAGLLFGTLTGTIIVSISGTVAASIAFLIARYFARERILKLVEGNKKFMAIDKAIGENGFKVVTLLRLSPLLPFSLGNYLYGLTSVKFVPYVLGSWLGMLPGTWAYVSAGAFGRAIIQEESELGLSGGNNQLWTLGLGLLATALAATYVTRLAKCKDNCKNSVILEPKSMEFISALAAGNQAKLMVDISSVGISPLTLALAVAAKQTGGLLLCIRSHLQTLQETKTHLENFHLCDVVELKLGNPSEVVKQYENIDFAVVDSRVVEGCSVSLFFALDASMNPDGSSVVVVNNIVGSHGGRGHHGRSYAQVVRGLRRRGVESVILPIGDGMEVIRTGKQLGDEHQVIRRRPKRVFRVFED